MEIDMKTAIFTALLHFLLFVPSAMAQSGSANEGLTESVHRISLSRGGDLNVLVSKRTGTSPNVAVLLFPGYPGILKLRETAGAPTYDLAGNFVIRARRFLNSEKVFAVAVDCPVDQWNACDDAYRSSSQHAADIRDVIASVKAAHGAQHVYILGTSYGTESSSFLALALGAEIDGAIHTATFTDPGSGRKAHGTPMASFDWSKVKAPQLFVHHKDDPCELTRYSSVVARKGDIPLITVEGVTNPRGDACQAFTAHGFVGREKVVMTAVQDWIAERKSPTTIGAAE
jgi:serine aminopeptidase S33 family